MRNIKIAFLALPLLLTLLFIATFIVYDALILTFGVPEFSIWIAGTLGILTLSILLSLILGSRHYNAFTRAYYRASMIWMGLFGYLFIGALFLLFTALYFIEPSQLLSATLFFLISAIIAYGILHAQKLVVKNITITLPSLPESWRGKKALWISDLHIGQIYGEKRVAQIVENIKKVSPNIVFIGGDLYDGSITTHIVNAIEPFRKLSIPSGIYFVAGNHEGHGDRNLFFKKIKEVGITILNDEKIILDGLQLIGVDFESTTKKTDFQAVLDRLHIDRNLPSILLKHEPRYVELAEKAGISFQISGHTHRAQQWPFEYLAKLTYGRFAYGLQKLENMWTYTSSGAGTWGPPIRVGTDCEIVVFTFERT